MNLSNKIVCIFSFTLDILTICICVIILKREAGWTILFHPARIFASKITHLVRHAKNRWAKSKCGCYRKATGSIAFRSLLFK